MGSPEDMPITDSSSARAYIDAVYERQWMKTADGVDIAPGLWVFTYDYKWGQVDKVDFDKRLARNEELKQRGFEPRSDDFWFDVIYPDGSKGWFNGERMTTICARCYRKYNDCKHKENA